MTRRALSTLFVMMWCCASFVVLDACTPSDLPENAQRLETCCEGAGACLPTAFVEDKYLSLLSKEGCSSEAVCVPEGLQRMETPAVCRVGLTGGEGRCLPACLPSVKERERELERDGCEKEQRCVPCYDPLTGESTGACSLLDDPGASEPPRTFESCCEGVGRCVPTSALPLEQRNGLGPDRCRSSELCVPEDALQQGDAYAPEACVAPGLEVEGRCVPECLPQLADQLARLSRASCREHHVCAPCFDPLTGKSTGACTLGKDRPARAAQRLDACCGGAGHCLPESLVPATQRAQLGPTGCTQDQLCVPDAFTQADFAPPTCTVAAAGVEGRCLPTCLPAVQEQLGRLTRDDCPADQACVPCFDPLEGKATGACALGNDEGPRDGAKVFSGCCGGRGRCLPARAVPEDQRGLLAQRECADEADLCVPNEIARATTFRPRRCTAAALGAEGRCLSTCLPDVAARAAVLERESCEDGELCVPCADPISGDDTGACSVGDDQPETPPVRLAACCNDLGRCTPRSFVPGELASNFGRDVCESDGALCVAPLEALTNPEFTLTKCEDPSIGAEGRCLPSCLPILGARAAALTRSTCEADYLCVPCFDPITGLPSGACDLGADRGPSKPPVVFERCCGADRREGSGVCVPESRLPNGVPELPRQTCSNSEHVCAPSALVENANAPLPSCRTSTNGAGVCIEECYLDSLARAVSPQRTCEAGQRCVGCSLLGGGIGGCPR